MRPDLACLFLLLPALLSAEDRFVVDDDAFVEQTTAAATALHAKGSLVSLAKLRAEPGRAHCELALPAPRKVRLEAPELHRLLRGSTVVVASFYHCAECAAWHLDAASGFVVADGVVSTCAHVADFDDEAMKEAFLVVADAKARVFPVTEVLVSNVNADTCLLRVPGLDLPPLPLGNSAQVGDRVYCLSHPDGNHWMFTAGMVSRFFLNREAAADGDREPAKARAAPALYLNITAEYSPGSSGAPVVDECGNVVAQVQSITSSVEEEKGGKGGSVTASYGMPLRSCVSSEEIARLTRPPGKPGK